MRTRQEFLKELEKLLLWKYDTSDIKDILNDYKEYFEIGMESGKSEECIIHELGSPLYVVRSIQLENGSKKRKIFTRQSGVRIITAILLILFSAYVLLLSNMANQDIQYVIEVMGLYITCLILGIWIILGGMKFSLAWLSSSLMKRKNIIYYGIHSILLCLFLLILLLNLWIHYDIEGLLRILLVIANGELGQVGSITATFYTSILAISLLIGLWGIYEFRRYSLEGFCIFCHSMGVSGVCIAMYHVLKMLSSPDEFKSLLFISIIPYLVGMVFIVVFFIYINQAHKKNTEAERG